MARSVLFDVPRDEPRQADARSALRQHVQPQFRGTARAGRADASGLAGNGRCRGGDRAAVGCKAVGVRSFGHHVSPHHGGGSPSRQGGRRPVPYRHGGRRPAIYVFPSFRSTAASQQIAIKIPPFGLERLISLAFQARGQPFMFFSRWIAARISSCHST